MAREATTDVLVIGGGIVGLSVAFELVTAGRTVRVVERGELGKEASWAGAGILPPGAWFSNHPTAGAMAALCRHAHGEWSARLREESGVDDELEACGALYAVTEENLPELSAKFNAWRERGLESQFFEGDLLHGLEPTPFACERAFYVEDESQLRNPRRMTALRTACERRGVTFTCGVEITGLVQEANRVVAATSAGQEFSAGDYCLTNGAWAGELAPQLGLHAPVFPVRGQMLLLKTPRRVLQRIHHFDGKYLVPRREGRVLVGSTIEEAGFDKSTVRKDLDALLGFAHHYAPCLKDAEVEASWAGLRPATPDGLPLVGRAPGLENGWIAAGHFRSGLQFAPATAVAMRKLLAGEQPDFDLAPLAPDRFLPCAEKPAPHPSAQGAVLG